MYLHRFSRKWRSIQGEPAKPGWPGNKLLKWRWWWWPSFQQLPQAGPDTPNMEITGTSFEAFVFAINNVKALNGTKQGETITANILTFNLASIIQLVRQLVHQIVDRILRRIQFIFCKEWIDQQKTLRRIIHIASMQLMDKSHLIFLF